MSEQREQDNYIDDEKEKLQDSKADAIAAIVLILTTAMIAIHWVSNQ